MTHHHDVTSADIPDAQQPACTRHHLPAVHLDKLSSHLSKAKSLAANSPAAITAPGLTGWVASGHTRGQTTWAVVILTCLMIASETTHKIAKLRHRR